MLRCARSWRGWRRTWWWSTTEGADEPHLPRGGTPCPAPAWRGAGGEGRANRRKRHLDVCLDILRANAYHAHSSSLDQLLSLPVVCPRGEGGVDVTSISTPRWASSQ